MLEIPLSYQHSVNEQFSGNFYLNSYSFIFFRQDHILQVDNIYMWFYMYTYTDNLVCIYIYTDTYFCIRNFIEIDIILAKMQMH